MDILTSILYNPVFLYLLGMFFARFPGVREQVANRYIPLIQTILAAVVAALAPQAAHAGGGPLALPVIGVTFGLGGLGGFFGGMLATVGAAAWQAAQAHIIHRMFGRPLAGADPKDSLK